MSNTIERIKKEIKDWQADIHDNEYNADKFDFVFDRILEIIDEELAKEPQVPQWIPCSERLPEETGYYLCSVEWYGTSTKELLISNGHEIQDRIMLLPYLESNKSFKEIENFSTYKVIAWQPLQLPQPYTENRKESQKCRKIMC